MLQVGYITNIMFLLKNFSLLYRNLKTNKMIYETLSEFLKFLRTKPRYMIQYSKFDEILIYEFTKELERKNKTK